MEEYSVREILSTFGISRSTLLYYEKQGIVRASKNPNNGYRVFSHDEVNRLKTCLCLKNMGFSTAEAAEIFLSGRTFGEEQLEGYLRKIERQIELERATHAEIAHALDIQKEPLGVMTIVEEPELYYIPSGCEDGYHQILQSEASNRLIQHNPMTGYLLLHEKIPGTKKSDAHVARCIRKEFAPIVFGDVLPDFQQTGGGRALRVVIRKDDAEALPQAIAWLDKQGIRRRATPYDLVTLCAPGRYELFVPIE